MRISSGLAEINLSSVNKQKKVYLWPEYKNAKISRIKKVSRKTEGNAIYTKPVEEEKDKIFKQASMPRDQIYQNNGSQKPALYTGIKPGSFFDAIV